MNNWKKKLGGLYVKNIYTYFHSLTIYRILVVSMNTIWYIMYIYIFTCILLLLQIYIYII